MIRVIVAGAAGRMGKRLIANICESEDMTLAGATEYQGSPDIGKDAGMMAGTAPCGVKITKDFEALLDSADTVIDFSTGPVVANTTLAVKKGLSVVVGTTALGDESKKIFENLASNGGKIVFASNFSIGVNTLFHLSKIASGILGKEYDIEIVEMHHNQKKDAPSGTAITLAESVAEPRDMTYNDNTVHGREGIVGERPAQEIGMHAVRGGDIVGEHTVMFIAGGERVELTHKASTRDHFAKGALEAIRFLAQSPAGLYDMRDVLNLK